ncbi:MAG: hypothetical protein QJR08_04195 [Bacillota bacterium]|nr:hypothetical protein [Bacillota bacterium]
MRTGWHIHLWQPVRRADGHLWLVCDCGAFADWARIRLKWEEGAA